ncbi:hypothetical protein [Methylobacterium radiotolerans]|uniref:hypothetical protein n=1 Tax=Methylobacterium radiotolerans TaxID=31998 RepID=UPI001F3FCAA4|nr:hypothetical protein [Methylobacterium radiotolerans]UIY43424.1 hypothetical protein LZ599_06850 [Methylobacterium radiotolerans]
MRFADELGVALRTVHYWASKGPPSEIVYLLDLMTALERPSYSLTEQKNHKIRRFVKSDLNRLLDVAGERRRKEVLDIIGEWFDEAVSLHGRETK